MREIIIDTETTGLDPLGEDRIVEIAAVEIVNDSITQKIFHEYVNPERYMPDSAFRVHGISGAFLEGKPLFRDIVDGFIDFIGDDPLIAHNAEFDLQFINAELQRSGRSALDKNRFIDTLSMARRKHPGAPNSLDALCARYGIDRSRRITHGALIDSEILAEIYVELKGGRQKALSFSARKESRKIERKSAPKFRPCVLASRLSVEATDDHAQLVRGLAAPSVWTDYWPADIN